MARSRSTPDRLCIQWRIREIRDLLGSQMGITLQLLPGGMQRELLDFMDFVSALEEAAGGLVPPVVKV